MSKIGCIVMYSKPVGNNKTSPKGTIFYNDGTEKEVSLSEAASLALTMAIELGYENPIENERYFNTTFIDFINNKNKYKKIAETLKENEEQNGENEPAEENEEQNEANEPDEEKETTASESEEDNKDLEKELEDIKKKLFEEIVEVEPPKVVKAEPKKEENEISNENATGTDLIIPFQKRVESSDEDISTGFIDKKIEELLEKENHDESISPTQNDLLKMINDQNKNVEGKSSSVK